MADCVFEVEGVAFRYPGRDEDALRGVTVNVPAGQVVCLVGKNGSGKSTLLYLLGLLAERPPRAGRVRFQPRGAPALDYGRLTAADRNDLRRQRFGFALQEPYLMPQLTCAENLAMPLLLQGVPLAEALRKAHDLLARLGPGIAALAGRDGGGTLSGGERKMMAVLRGLVHEPEVVFADEPIDSADAGYREQILRLLCGWQQNGDGPRRSLLLVLHDLAEAWRLGESFILLTSGHRARDDRAFGRDEIFEEAHRDGISPAERLERWVRDGR